MEVLHEIDPAEIAELETMEKRCHELHAVPPTYATLEMEVSEVESGLVTARYADLSRSWTRNYYNSIAFMTFHCAMNACSTGYAAGSLQMKDTAAAVESHATYTIAPGAQSSGYIQGNEQGAGSGIRAAAAGVTNGIVIGTNNTAESIDDYKIGTIIAEGAGAGQMNYMAMSAPAVTWIGTPTFKFKAAAIRIIINNSAGSIGVNEVALYSVFSFAGSTIYVCVSRDKLIAQVDVASASQVTVTYNLYSPAYP